MMSIREIIAEKTREMNSLYNEGLISLANQLYREIMDLNEQMVSANS